MKLRADTRVVQTATAWAAFLGIMTFAIVVPVLGSLTRSVIGAFGGLLPAIVSSVLLVRHMKKRPRDIEASGTELVAGETRIPHADLHQGYFAPATPGVPAHVAVDAKGKSVRIDVADEAQANTLLDALGLGVEQRATKFFAVSKTSSKSGLATLASFAIAIGASALAAATNAPALFVLATLFAIAAVSLFVPATVGVGADGVAVKGRIHSEFYDFSDIRGVRPTRRGVELVLRANGDGERVVAIPMTSNFGLVATEIPVRDALVQRIEAAAARHREDATRATSPRADVGPWLDRGTRGFAEWLAELGKVEGDFRTAPVRNDDLVALVESTSAPPARRVAAAVAIAKRGTDDDRGRIRVAAEAIAAPKLRVALEAIAEGADDARVETAILEAEAEAGETEEAAR